MIGLVGIDTLELYSNDPSRLAEFYEFAFGVTFESHEANRVGYIGRGNGTRLVLRETPTLVRHIAATSLEWLVEDTAQAAEHLAALAIPYTGPSSQDRDGWADSTTCVVLTDPDGNRITLVERHVRRTDRPQSG